MRIKFEVCSVCQLSCRECAHKGLIQYNPKYQLSMEKLRLFLHYTEQSGYKVKLNIHGSGEPLLWKHLNEGLVALKESPCVKQIEISTNGLGINRVNGNVWPCIDLIYVSIYPGFPNHFKKKIASLKRRYRTTQFRIVNKVIENLWPRQRQPGTIPCQCKCPGPMYYDGRIFWHCGPPGFLAAKRAGVDLYSEEYSEPIGVGWADKQSQAGNMPICEFCYSNDKIVKDTRRRKSMKKG